MKEATMRTRNKLLVTFAVFLMFLSIGQSAQAVLNAVGPTNPVNGFPQWYQDTFGVALEQCNFSAASPDPFCIPAGPAGVPIPNIDFEEAFWFAGDAAAAGQGVNGILVQNLEAAFATGEPVAGEQIVFARIRIRIDVPVAGQYTVTYPYGVKVYNVTTPGTRAINDTVDVGIAPGVFTDALNGAIGPFLKCVTPPPPPGYLGDFGTPCTVTGSPFGTNFFRIQGPGGINVTTNQFSVSGKIFTGVLPTPLVVERATYARSATGQVDVFALSSPAATVNVAGGPNLPAGNLPMAGDANGNFFLDVFLPNPAILPTTITVTASLAGSSPTPVVANLTDMVDITSAVYDMNTSTLNIAASSSDQTGAPALIATGFGPLAMVGGAGTLSVPLDVPPAEVTVSSTKGGVAVKDISIVSVPTFSLSGSVQTGTGAPIAGVTIALTGAATRTTTTGDDGTYSFALLKNGAYTITPGLGGVTFAPLSRNATIAGADLGGQNFTGTLAAIFSISGTVLTAGASPMAGVTMTLTGTSGATTATLADGTYSFANLTNGSYTVTPSLAGFSFTPPDRIVAISGANQPAQDFTGAPLNAAPTITSTPVTTGAVGQIYTYDVNATDPDGDVLTYSLVIAPAGMTINATTGLISWTPTAGQAGPNNVTVRATDPGALFAEQSFTIAVTQPDTIAVTRAQFTQSTNTWRIEGTSLPIPVGARTITIYLGPTVGGTLIGTTNVAADGKWIFQQANSPVRPPSTLNQRISVQSSSGGKLENVVLTIVR
jgi:hypothetical protein